VLVHVRNLGTGGEGGAVGNTAVVEAPVTICSDYWVCELGNGRRTAEAGKYKWEMLS
jgi:hypothetical protein